MAPHEYWIGNEDDDRAMRPLPLASLCTTVGGGTARTLEDRSISAQLVSLLYPVAARSAEASRSWSRLPVWIDQSMTVLLRGNGPILIGCTAKQ